MCNRIDKTIFVNLCLLTCDTFEIGVRVDDAAHIAHVLVRVHLRDFDWCFVWELSAMYPRAIHVFDCW